MQVVKTSRGRFFKYYLSDKAPSDIMCIERIHLEKTRPKFFNYKVDKLKSFIDKGIIIEEEIIPNELDKPKSKKEIKIDINNLTIIDIDNMNRDELVFLCKKYDIKYAYKKDPYLKTELKKILNNKDSEKNS